MDRDWVYTDPTPDAEMEILATEKKHSKDKGTKMKTLTAKSFLSRLGAARAVLIAGALFAIGLSHSAKADSIYTYIGNDYTICSGTYCAGGPYALRVTFDTALTGNALDNLSFADITSTIASFTFADGRGLTVAEHTVGGSVSASISTDAYGNIVSWLVGGYADSANVQMQTNWNSPTSFFPGADFSETTVSFGGSYGFISSNPGTWVMQASTSVPEPTYGTLLGAGLLGLLALAARSRRLAPWVSR